MKSHWEIPFYALNAIFSQYFTEYVDNLGCVLWFCDDCVSGFFFNEIVHNLISYQYIHKTLNRKYSKCFCTQLHEHFHLFTFQMYNAFENCIYGYWISQRDFFSGRPPPPNLLFPLLCIKSNKQNWDIPLFKACLLYYILRFFPRESLAVLGGGKMNLFCAIILHLVIIRR